MKKIRNWFLQIIADTLIKRLYQIKDNDRWSKVFALGLELDNWCVNHNIYLK